MHKSPPCSPCPPGTIWTLPSHLSLPRPPRSCGLPSTDTRRAWCTPTSTTSSLRSSRLLLSLTCCIWHIQTLHVGRMWSACVERPLSLSSTDLTVCLCRERLSCLSPLKMKPTKTCLQQCNCFDLSVSMFTECSSACQRPERRLRDSPWGRTASLSVSYDQTAPLCLFNTVVKTHGRGFWD